MKTQKFKAGDVVVLVNSQLSNMPVTAKGKEFKLISHHHSSYFRAKGVTYKQDGPGGQDGYWQLHADSLVLAKRLQGLELEIKELQTMGVNG